MSLFNQFPHISNYKLFIWPSPAIFTATVTGSPARGSREITTTGGSIIETVYPGYTLETNSDAGTTRAAVRTRIKSIDGNVITVAENAINWQNGDIVTIFKEMQPWSVKPRIIVNGDQPTFYKDYDIEYVDQNQNVKPVVNMGPHYAGPLGVGVYYTALSSFDVQGTSLASYAWSFEGGIPGTSTLATPGYVYYPVAGNYITRLTITNSLGAAQTSSRFVTIGDDGHNDWGIESLEGNVDTGYILKGWAATNQDGKLRSGALVVVYGEERYGGALFQNAELPFRHETIFVGYISKRSVKWNVRFARWDFEAVSISIYGDLLDVYDTALQFRESSGRWLWWKYYRLTADKGIINHLMWHTNILDIADFVPSGDTRFVKEVDIGRGGPFSAIRQFLNYSRPGWISCNAQGKIHVQRDPNLLEVVDRPATTWFTLTPNEYREEPYVVDEDPFTTSHVGAGGFAFSGPTGTSTPYLSAAPMEAADDYGRPQDYQGLILTPSEGQDGLNRICGHMFARDNNEFKDTNWPLVGNFRPFVDVVPIRRVTVNDPGDPLLWNGENFYPKRVSHRYDSKTMMLVTDLNMSRETIGLPGVSVPIPELEIPDPPPPPPPPPVIIPPIVGPRVIGAIWYVTSHLTSQPDANHLVYAGDLSTASQPTYTTMNVPTNFSSIVTVTDLFDHILHVAENGSRLLITGKRTGDSRNTIWECTNWSSIWNNPTPPAAVWVERVVYGSTTYGGQTINVVGTFTACNVGFDRNNVAYFTCKLGTTYSIGRIATDGTLTVNNVSFTSTNYGIGTEVHADQSLTSGTSHLRDFTGAILHTWNDSVFGIQEASSPYRNAKGGPAVTAYIRDQAPERPLAVRYNGGFYDLVNTMGVNTWAIFGGNPQGTVVYVTHTQGVVGQGAWVSLNGGSVWSAFATWMYGYLKPISISGNTGCLWVPYEAVTNSNVPNRFYDQAGAVINDLTGNWWTQIFATRTSTEVRGARAWYGT